MRYRYSTGKDGKLEKKALVYTHDEHGINVGNVDNEAVGVIQRLKDMGYETYIVGGAVRDLILGKKPKDFDIVSEASPVQIRKIFRNSRIIGRRFKLVHVYFGPRIYEVSTFRSLRDGLTGNTFGTIEEDVLRRDFTMNALFYDPGQQIVVDYIGGMKDIQAKRVKAIIPLATIFKDDPVRMIRAVKYAAATGFTLPLPLKWKIKAQSPLLASISPSRLTEEIFKIINSPYAASIVEALDGLGLYAYLQPDASRLMRGSTGFRIRYLRSLAALNGEGFKNRPGETLGALINDYMEDTTDPELSTSENYKAIYTAARNFVLPMNPPRFELEHAVRRFFSSRGIQIRKSQFVEKAGGPTQENAGTNTGETKSRRRRHRRKPGSKPAAK
ncbi:MAG: polynucleotide adenylyltransferase PcnB [Treponema sp.]|nr:polynucleotide adenylyltransferase PcnB [Treponema sp.]